MWNIENIISKKSIKILMQPIISIKKKSIIGYEALARGIDNNGNFISAFDLFDSARKANKLFELDNICRLIAVEEFNKIFDKKYLFLNFEVSTLNRGIVGKNSLIGSLNILIEKLKDLNIATDRIVIEIVESKVKDTELLNFFTELCKSFGFLIALDDVGSGHSNLNRIPLLKPNIIKIDRYLVTNIHNDFYKQEVFRAITNLSRSLGTLVISEGVETEEEAVYSIEFRADMIQGYYFSKPIENPQINLDNDVYNLCENFNKNFILKMKQHKQSNDILIENIKELSQYLKFYLKNSELPFNYTDLDDKIKVFIKKYNYIECIYFLDSMGLQISKTFFNENLSFHSNSNLFSPPAIGDNHSLKQYFYKLMVSQNDYYISNEYLSLASGKRCKTISTYINNNIILSANVII